ncbi:hypothetical protein BX616_005107 [Lobosporangium transversale]|uniref:Galactose oxidase n=1 Tax=Lobosporangium transversale TaxID=64571 RepID=A0A1Y2H424_9FUNG|nr:hypothetical protein BCR41DRAFT_74389 [Lobosporangium transversale]KAF9897714.1 hypothetical protein BX616_005107 [Lobosporangium transversale]ORZ28463.1 hypothetical protein BCR41DRAFT_74389 [Lobosporangium transversale]|eukprot:XP_021886148.1 hypothetical protein BCR41DRAFT_74389 [Lobosporangium transversale]
MVIHGISLLSLARLLLLLIFSHEIAAQNASNYKPISYAASAILSDGSLYLYGGVIKFAVTNAGTSQFLRIDLTQNFDTTSPPWVTLPGYLTYTMVEATPSMNGEQLILGGNRDIDGPLSYIYDVAHAKWTITPTLPGMSTMTGYKRSNVGMALDRHTGLVYIYGGFNRDVFLRELSVLDTNNKGPSEMKWTLSFNQATIPTLYEPYVLYLPTQRKILVMAGCVRMDTQGYASACTPLNVGYLVSGGASRETLSLQTQQLSTGPAARYQGCRVVLANGDVFIQGGRDPTTFYGDAWLLNVGNWSWTSITINGPPAAMTRAGHTCQLGPNGQVIIIGGKTFGIHKMLY